MAGSCRLTVLPDKKTAVVEQGASVLQALQQLDIPVRSDCGGAGVCGKCRVLASDTIGLSPADEKEHAVLGEEQVKDGYRMACLATVTGEATVVVPEAVEISGTPQGKEIKGPVCNPDPSVCRLFIEAELLTSSPSFDWGRGLLLNRLPQWPEFPVEESARQLVESLADCQLQSGQAGVTLVCHEQRGITAVLPGKRMRSLGLAVDLGTTTIAAYLCDLQEGELLASGAMFNPQRRYGDDVISRIGNAVESDAALVDMQQAVASALDQLAGKCLADCGLQDEQLDELVLVGNTTMQTIFAGDSPESLGRSPYSPQTLAARNFTGESLGLALGKGTNVYIFPVISGFLGGDIVAAGLGGDLMHLSEPRLIVDIGTNGELLLGCGGRILGTSCATGPALEGAAISCGMRAVPGAIDKVYVAEEGNRVLLHHIGAENGALPLGICGSGLIDAIACLRQTGVLLESGRINENAKGVVCDDRGMGQAYILVPAEESGTGSDITLTLQDVRAFQLAKSALVVGIEKLLERYGLESANSTCITGAFGAHFNWHNGVAVDMLSTKVTRGEVSSGANLAGAGAMMALLDRGKRREAEELAKRCVALELAADPDFNMLFVERTKFPALKN